MANSSYACRIVCRQFAAAIPGHLRGPLSLFAPLNSFSVCRVAFLWHNNERPFL